MDKEKAREVTKTLEKLQEALLNRIPRATELSPDTVSEEIEALNELLDLKSKLALV